MAKTTNSKPKSHRYTVLTGALLAVFMLFALVFLFTLLNVTNLPRTLFNGAWMTLLLLWILRRCSLIFHPRHTRQARVKAIAILIGSSIAGICILAGVILTNFWIFFAMLLLFCGASVVP